MFSMLSVMLHGLSLNYKILSPSHLFVLFQGLSAAEVWQLVQED